MAATMIGKMAGAIAIVHQGAVLRLPTDLNARLVDRLIIPIAQQLGLRALRQCGAETRATLAISTEMATASAANRRADNAEHASGAGRGLRWSLGSGLLGSGIRQQANEQQRLHV